MLEILLDNLHLGVGRVSYVKILYGIALCECACLLGSTLSAYQVR